ncbi:MAG: hypothetical protein JKP98_05410 [Rhodobacteraceae bacterium]|nr:hypothetical protein [Paracoccaceae bacterium]
MGHRPAALSADDAGAGGAGGGGHADHRHGRGLARDHDPVSRRPRVRGALVLPLAFPAYVLAYAYTHLLDHPGAVQTGCARSPAGGRATTGFPKSARWAARRRC